MTGSSFEPESLGIASSTTQPISAKKRPADCSLYRSEIPLGTGFYGHSNLASDDYANPSDIAKGWTAVCLGDSATSKKPGILLVNSEAFKEHKLKPIYPGMRKPDKPRASWSIRHPVHDFDLQFDRTVSSGEAKVGAEKILGSGNAEGYTWSTGPLFLKLPRDLDSGVPKKDQIRLGEVASERQCAKLSERVAYCACDSIGLCSSFQHHDAHQERHKVKGSNVWQLFPPEKQTWSWQ